MTILRITGVLILIVALSCSRGYKPAACLEEPESDATYPGLELVIKYYDGSRHRSLTLNQEDAAAKITANKDYPVTILYSGQDEEGMKSIHLSVTVKKNILGQEQKREYNIMPLTASCPKAELSDTFIVEKEAGARTVDVQLKGANWLNMRSATEVHTMAME